MEWRPSPDQPRGWPQWVGGPHPGGSVPLHPPQVSGARRRSWSLEHYCLDISSATTEPAGTFKETLIQSTLEIFAYLF